MNTTKLRAGWEHATVIVEGTAHPGYMFEPSTLEAEGRLVAVIPATSRRHRWFVRTPIGDRVVWHGGDAESPDSCEHAMVLAERQLIALAPVLFARITAARQLQVEDRHNPKISCPRCGVSDQDDKTGPFIDNVGDGEHALCLRCGLCWPPFGHRQESWPCPVCLVNPADDQGRDQALQLLRKAIAADIPLWPSRLREIVKMLEVNHRPDVEQVQETEMVVPTRKAEIALKNAGMWEERESEEK